MFQGGAKEKLRRWSERSFEQNKGSWRTFGRSEKQVWINTPLTLEQHFLLAQEV